MKLKFFILSLISVAFLLTSCDEFSSLLPPTSILDKTEYSIPADGGTVSIKFTPTASWTAQIDVDFVTLSATSGEASETEYELVATVAKNTADTSRTATISLKVGESSVDVKLVQEAAATLPDLPPGPDGPGTDDPGTDDPGTDDPGKEDPTGTTEDVTPGNNVTMK